MTISVDALALLVSAATLVTVLAPLVLIILWLSDWIKGRLW
ncbi:MAG: hypothetical protein ACWGNB_02830 [Thiogranum sp.]